MGIYCLILLLFFGLFSLFFCEIVSCGSNMDQIFVILKAKYESGIRICGLR